MMERPPIIGVVSAGSSFKFAPYEGELRTLSGRVEGVGMRPATSAQSEHGEPLTGRDMARLVPATSGYALMALPPWLRAQLSGRAVMAIDGGFHTLA